MSPQDNLSDQDVVDLAEACSLAIEWLEDKPQQNPDYEPEDLASMAREIETYRTLIGKLVPRDDPEVVVWYTVPVAVHVNLKERTVSRVVTIDEESKPDAEVGVRWDDYSTGVPGTVAALATEIAETGGEAGWPRWEYGY
jgi:hypothetical protein